MPRPVFAPYTGQGPLGDVPPGIDKVTLAKAQFLTWLKQSHPAVFRHGLEVAETAKSYFAAQTKNPAALSGLAETEDGTVKPTTWWQSFAEGITQAGTAYLAYKGQKASIEMNMQRAQQGLPPIDYSRYNAPTVRTQVDVSPEILARLREGGMNTLMLVGLAVGGFFLISKLARR